MIRRLRLRFDAIAWSLETLRTQRQTPLSDREGLPIIRWWKLPLCWLRGHDFYARNGAIEITSWRLQFCECCGQEIVGRTRWSQIDTRPLDYDDYWDHCDEREGDR